MVRSPDMSLYTGRVPIQWAQMRQGGLLGTDVWGHVYIIRREVTPRYPAGVFVIALRNAHRVLRTGRARSQGRAQRVASRLYPEYLAGRD